MIIKLLLLFLLVINQNNKTKSNVTPVEKQNEIVDNKSLKNNKPTINKIEQPIGNLKIDNININNPIYAINSKHNNIEENVTILRSEKNPLDKSSLIVLAAHSGEGKIAYFNNLNKLKIDDEIKLTYYDKDYTYIVTDIFTQNKNGHINIFKKEKSELILTTCDITDQTKQLIVKCIIKEA